jgi:Cof subfamily protein (haloacid dehalogenase superfamily)
MGSSRKIRLVIADLDGTLIDPGKAITTQAVQAIQELRNAGILFSLVSGRPPFGMRMYSDPLAISLPISGFNGGEITTPDFYTVKRLTLPEDTAREIEDFFLRKRLKFWIYRGSDWLVNDPETPHLSKEATNVSFQPSIVPSFDGHWTGVTKMVGISDDPDYLAGCEKEAQELFRGKASAARSQPYYLDITHKEATKEVFVEHLAQSLSISRDEVATIGDMPSDLPMFQACGLSIAMGNAPEAVKAAAMEVTLANSQEGFAYAMREFVLRPMTSKTTSKRAA